MKKISILLLVLVVAIGLTGCGKSDDNEESSVKSENKEELKSFFKLELTESSSMLENSIGLMEALKAENERQITDLETYGETSVQMPISVIDTAMEQAKEMKEIESTSKETEAIKKKIDEYIDEYLMELSQLKIAIYTNDTDKYSELQKNRKDFASTINDYIIEQIKLYGLDQ